MSQFVDEYECEEDWEWQEWYNNPLDDSGRIANYLPFKSKPFLWFHWCKLPRKQCNYNWIHDLMDCYAHRAAHESHVLYGGCINEAEGIELDEMDAFFQDVTEWVMNESPGGRRIMRRKRKQYKKENDEVSKYDEFDRIKFYIERKIEKHKNIQRKIEYDNKIVRLESRESLVTVEPQQYME